MLNSKIKYIFTFFLILLISGCIVVKHEEEKETSNARIILSPRPTIPMSEELVRSKKGDIIAFLPKDWFLVDVEEKAPSDIFAVAVNPDYTLSLIFSNFKISESKSDIIKKEGLLGLARISFEKHSKKTGGAVKQAGNYQVVNIGPQSFAKYEFLTTGGTLQARTAVFVSSINEYYELSMVPMTFNGKPLPANSEINEIFNSVLATVQY
jgi:hypothetical protein